MLDQMLMQQHEQDKGTTYNEPILSAKKWQDSLPHTILACFYPSYARADQQQHARTIHQAFLRRYRLTWQQVPLVVYDPHGGARAFTLAP